MTEFHRITACLLFWLLIASAGRARGSDLQSREWFDVRTPAFRLISCLTGAQPAMTRFVLAWSYRNSDSAKRARTVIENLAEGAE